jgi:hypothetical protein
LVQYTDAAKSAGAAAGSAAGAAIATAANKATMNVVKCMLACDGWSALRWRTEKGQAVFAYLLDGLVELRLIKMSSEGNA